MARSGVIAMIGTAQSAHGGVASVIRGYYDAGLDKRWPLQLIVTHSEGNIVAKLVTWLRAYGQLLGLLLTGRCLAVHLHTASHLSFWRKYTFHLMARAAHVPVVWHIHGAEFDSFYLECSPSKQRMVSGALRGAFRVIALSPTWGAFLRKIAPGAQVEVILNSVAIPDTSGFPPREPQTILFMSRIIRLKGVFELLDALRLIVNDMPGVRLELAGSGEDKEDLAAYARELGLADHVHFLGWISGAERDGAIARAGMLVLPSHAEGLPMILLEAMGMGTPVVASRVGGTPDLVADGQTGLLVEAFDVPGLANAMRRLLTDARLAETLGRQGRELVMREYAIQTTLSRLGGIYQGMGVRAIVTEEVATGPV